MSIGEQVYQADRLQLTPKGFWERKYLKWYIYSGFYGNARQVEADLSFSQENFRLGLAINMSFSGGYSCQLCVKNGRQLLMLLRRSVQNFCEKYIYLDTLGIELQVNQMFHIALCCDKNSVIVELDGKNLLQFDHREGEEMYLCGECGCLTSPNLDAVQVENFIVRGEMKDRPETSPKMLPEPYVYTMNLETAEDGPLPAEWTKNPGTEVFCVKHRRLVSDNVPYAESLIYQFDHNPKLHARFAVSELEEKSKFGFIIRKAPRTAFVTIGYSVESGAWYLQDVPALYNCEIRTTVGAPCAMESGREYEIEIIADGCRVEVLLDGKAVLCADDVRQRGYGKTGVFSESAVFSVSELQAEFASGVAPTLGALCYCVDEEPVLGNMEVEVLEDGELIGIAKRNHLYQSLDWGESFHCAPEEYSGMMVDDIYYQSVTKLHDGKFMQILLSRGSEIQISDDLKTWTTIGRVVPDEWVELVKAKKIITHVGSFTEFQKPDGGYRIFLPMSLNTYKKDVPSYPKGGHDSLCFYSDDGGKSWKHTDWISSVVKSYNGAEPIDWCESKVIKCADGSLRLYCSRNNSHYFSFVESFDFGETWHNVSVIPQMQCALASYGIAQDPQSPGTWYVAWVNDKPYVRGHLFSRTRLSLARTSDGKNWEFLADLERSGERFPDGAAIDASPLFQIIDPCVNVDDRYIYVTWGGSAWKSNTRAHIHNELRAMFARVEKDKLQAQPWSPANICDMSKLSCDLTKEKW